jgi:polysaccharide biosynthesis/export protein
MNRAHKIKTFVLFALVALFFTSCVSNKKILYLQDAPPTIASEMQYQTTLQPDDNLLITITAAEPELVNDFNLMYLNARSTEMRTTTNDALYTYLIDSKGEINFPVLGKIKLAGLTRIEAEDKIKNLLNSYVQNAGVSIRVMNFRVSVLGEVSKPGPQIAVGDRMTIFDAISGAGDLTIYGKRKNIMVLREKDNVKTITEVDITDPNIINTPYYYLAHNDVIYVQPNKTRVNSSVIGPNITVAVSVISLLITIIALTTR